MRGRERVEAEEDGAATARFYGVAGGCERPQWSIGPNGIFRQPEIVVGTWCGARAEQDDFRRTRCARREALRQINPLWDELFPAEQARIMLVERVDVRMHGVEVRLLPNGWLGWSAR